MLVLSRKVGHRIVIAGDIEITVMQVRGNKVQLGVTAPREISIVRCEARPAGEETRDKLPYGSLARPR